MTAPQALPRPMRTMAHSEAEAEAEGSEAERSEGRTTTTVRDFVSVID